MTLSISCKDVGTDCDFVAQAETEDELLQKVAQHAKEAHGMMEVDADTLAKVKSAIKET